MAAFYCELHHYYTLLFSNGDGVYITLIGRPRFYVEMEVVNAVIHNKKEINDGNDGVIFTSDSYHRHYMGGGLP